jgi:hypothetical protein
LQPFIGFIQIKTEALFLSNRYGVHHFWIGFIIDSNSVLDDTGGSFTCGIGSSIFHPEASRVAFWVLAGKRFGPIHLSVGR